MVDKSAYLYLLASLLLWGSAPLVEKLALGEADPVTGLFVRTVAGGIAISATVALTGGLKAVTSVSLKGLGLWATSGILASYLGMLAYFEALKRLPVGKAVPISSCYPLVTALLAIVLLGEALSWKRIAGTALIVFGVWLVSEARLPWEVGM